VVVLFLSAYKRDPGLQHWSRKPGQVGGVGPTLFSRHFGRNVHLVSTQWFVSVYSNSRYYSIIDLSLPSSMMVTVRAVPLSGLLLTLHRSMILSRVMHTRPRDETEHNRDMSRRSATFRELSRPWRPSANILEKPSAKK
jgi:signal transduction histidine kinase